MRNSLVPSDIPLERVVIPFTAIVNHEELKLALLLNAVNPRIGGLLVSGPKGTGKTTIVRALAALLPEIPVVKGCVFRCNPNETTSLCTSCAAKLQKGGKFTTAMQRMRVVDLPLSATEDRVVGSLDVERAIREGIAALKPGILAEANQHVLYVDEVNLLPDHIVDSLLDAAATGVNVVEREGISVSHPADFIFIGSMNPEEGELRPQLLDRFPLHVAIERPFSVAERVAIIQLNIAFDRDPTALRTQWESEEAALREEIVAARQRMPEVQVPDDVMQVIALMCSRLQVDGVRPDIVIAKTAMAYAALEGRTEVAVDDIEVVASLALSHRTRQRGILEPPSRESISSTLSEVRKKVKTGDPRSKGREGEPKERRSKLFSKFRKHHALDEKEDGERHVGRVPRRGIGGRASYTGFICYFFVLSAALIIWLSILLPLLGPINIVLGGLSALGLLLLLEQVMRRSKRPGFILPSLSNGRTPPQKPSKYRKATHKGSSSSPLAPSAKPKARSKRPPLITGEPREQGLLSVPDIVRLDEGRLLFQVQDLQQHRSFARQRLPKWSIRQIWRRTGSAQSHDATSGVSIGARIPHGSPRSIHIPASITAAASHAKQPSSQSLAVHIQHQDVREKRFRNRVPLTIIFVLDLSVSMLKKIKKLQRSILAFKSCLEGTRDRVGLIVLKDWGAAEVQAPTSNWARLVAKLLTLRLSGYTPLAAGLERALQTIKRERRRNPGVVPLVVVFSDFLPNIRLGGPDSPDLGLPEAISDVLFQSYRLGAERVPIVTIDVEHGFVSIKGKTHHDVIEEFLRKRAQELGITNLIEVGLKDDKLIPFLPYYVAYLAGGRVFLPEELDEPIKVIPAVMSLAHRGVW